MIEYGIFGWLLVRAIRLSYPARPFIFLAVAAFCLGVLYGASDEWHQSFVPSRDPNPKDLAADAVGVAFGIALWNKQKETNCG